MDNNLFYPYRVIGTILELGGKFMVWSAISKVFFFRDRMTISRDRMTISFIYLTVFIFYCASFLTGCAGNDLSGRAGHDNACTVNRSEYTYVGTEQLDTSSTNIKTIQQLAKGDGLFPTDLYYYLILGPYTRNAQIEVLPGFVQTLKQNRIYQLPTHASEIHSIKYLRCSSELGGSTQKLRAEGMSIEHKNIEPGNLYVLYTQEKDDKAVPQVRKIDYLELCKVKVNDTMIYPSMISLPDGRKIIGVDPDLSGFGAYARMKKDPLCAGQTHSALPMWFDIIGDTQVLPYIEICQTGPSSTPNKAISHVPWAWFRDKYLCPKK